jgi:hypothetical protein
MMLQKEKKKRYGNDRKFKYNFALGKDTDSPQSHPPPSPPATR